MKEGRAMMNTRTWIVALTLASTACHKTAATPAPPPPTVQVAQVEQMDVPLFREWVGTLDGFVNADIRPQVEGCVRKQAHTEGPYVGREALRCVTGPRHE